jgi:hypothetical protein
MGRRPNSLQLGGNGNVFRSVVEVLPHFSENPRNHDSFGRFLDSCRRVPNDYHASTVIVILRKSSIAA